VLAGCGEARQDAHEAVGLYRVQIVRAHFPFRQSIARAARLELTVRNAGLATMPNVAVTLDSLNYVSSYPELADSRRPVWIVDAGPGTIPRRLPQTVAPATPPGAGQTAFVNTWALGPLAPGRTRTFVWRVTPVLGGLHTVAFTVAAGLNGRAHIRLAGGGTPSGRFVVHIAPRPPVTHVDPETGRVVPGPNPVLP